MLYKTIKKSIQYILKGYLSNLTRLLVILFYFSLAVSSYLNNYISIMFILIFAIQIFSSSTGSDTLEISKFYFIQDFFEQRYTEDEIQKIFITRCSKLVELILNTIILLSIFFILIAQNGMRIVRCITLLIAILAVFTTIKMAISTLVEIFLLIEKVDQITESIITNRLIGHKEYEKVKKAKKTYDSYKLYESVYFSFLCLLFLTSGVVEFYFSKNFFDLIHSASLGFIFTLTISKITSLGATIQLLHKDKQQSLSVGKELTNKITVKEIALSYKGLDRPIKITLISENYTFEKPEDYIKSLILLNVGIKSSDIPLIKHILDSEKNLKEIAKAIDREDALIFSNYL